MRKPFIISAFLISIAVLALPAQSLKRMEFVDKPIPDILMALSMQSGISIIPDETVQGRASFFFPETDFRTALQAFLTSINLYFTEDRGVIYVSRMNVKANADGTVSVDAEDIDPGILLRAISRKAGKTILFDPLPKATLSIHSANVALLRAVESVIKPYPDYSAAQDKEVIYVKKADAAVPGKPGQKGAGLLSKDRDGLYSVDFGQARFLDLLDELMRSEKREYALLMRSDVLLDRMRFSGKSFGQMLRLVLEQAGGDYAEKDGIIYIFEMQKKDVAKKLKTTEIVNLTKYAAQDAVALLSQDLANSALYRIDKNNNSIILTGTAQEIAPIRDFLARLDAAPEGRELLRYRTSFIKAKELIPLIPARLAPIPPIQSPNEYVFFVSLAPEQKTDFEAFLAKTDKKDLSYPIRLKYLKAEEFLKALPPSVAKDELVESGTPSLLFFTGGEEKLKRLQADLELLDRPKPQIRYDVLAVQFNREKTINWKPSFSATKISGSSTDSSSTLYGPPTSGGTGSTAVAQPSRDAWSLVGALGNLLSVKFDVISKLGVLFGTQLDASLSDLHSQIFADTMVTAISGQEVKFQNTTTYRVRQSEVNDKGETTLTGPTKEVSSGLVLSINGWISGDGMVTMTVSSSLSERGSSESTDADQGIILPTNERVVSTQLRTPSGEPIILSGLIQRRNDNTQNKTIGLAEIPILGWLFKSKNNEEKFSEMAIYIVPRIMDSEEAGNPLSMDLESYYREFAFARSGSQATDGDSK